MAQILVRNLDTKTVERLKERAKRNRRSLQAEVRVILEDVARRGAMSLESRWELADRLRKELEGRVHSDSTLLIREDRDR